ncbi:MAG: hypothetical protein ACRCTY_07845 [Candidatus Adiutrix sp.]
MAETSIYGPTGDFSVATVYPEAQSSPWGCFAILIFFVLALGVIFTKGFHEASQPPPPQVSIISQIETIYNEESLRRDLLSMRRSMMRRNFVAYQINFTGAESRSFKYIISQLAPEMCQEISQVSLWPVRRDNGFTAQGTCVDSRQRSPEIEVLWYGREALISLPHRNITMSVELYPSI